jgi:hypothetical protein
LAKYVRSPEFRDEVIPCFEFLNERGFLGPETREYWLSYSSHRLGVEVFYDDREGSVHTTLRGPGGNPRASIECLYITAKLGPAQDMKYTARSKKALGRVLDSHVRALQKLLPIIEDPDGPRLLRACHGR